VNLDVPLNVFAEPTPGPPVRYARTRDARFPRRLAAADDVDRAIEMLLAAERPVIVVGQGAADGLDSARAAAGLALGARHVRGGGGHPGGQLAGREGPRIRRIRLVRRPVPWRHRRNGTLQANRATRNADVVLALGTRFDDRSTSSWLDGYTYAIPPTRLIHVHGDADEIGRNYPGRGWHRRAGGHRPWPAAPGTAGPAGSGDTRARADSAADAVAVVGVRLAR